MFKSVDRDIDKDSWKTEREYFEHEKEQSRSSLNALYSPRYASESHATNATNPTRAKQQIPISRIDVRVKSYLLARQASLRSPLKDARSTARAGPIKPTPDQRKLIPPNTERKATAAEVDQSYLQAQDTIFLMNSLRETRKGKTHQTIKNKYKLFRSQRGTKSWDQAAGSGPSLVDIKSLVREAAQEEPGIRAHAPLRRIASGKINIDRPDRTYRPPIKLLPADKHYSIRRHSSYGQLEVPSSGAQSVEGHGKSTRAERNWIWRGRRGSSAAGEGDMQVRKAEAT